MSQDAYQTPTNVASSIEADLRRLDEGLEGWVLNSTHYTRRLPSPAKDVGSWNHEGGAEESSHFSWAKQEAPDNASIRTFTQAYFASFNLLRPLLDRDIFSQTIQEPILQGVDSWTGR